MPITHSASFLRDYGDPLPVTVPQLLSDPEKYDEQYVLVSGIYVQPARETCYMVANRLGEPAITILDPEWIFDLVVVQHMPHIGGGVWHHIYQAEVRGQFIHWGGPPGRELSLRFIDAVKLRILDTLVEADLKEFPIHVSKAT